MEYCNVYLKIAAPNSPATGTMNGDIVFTPDNERGSVWSEGDTITPSAPVRCELSNGVLMYNGSSKVQLMAGGGGVNPEKVYWRVAFENMMLGEEQVQIDPFVFEAIPGETIDLARVTPVMGYTPPGVIRGPVGLKFLGVVNSASDLPSVSNQGDAYVNIANKSIFIWNGSKWEEIEDFASVDGNVETFNTVLAQANDAADLAEYWANETIQQVEGDFATRNYVDDSRWQKRYLTAGDNVDIFYREEHSGAWRVNTPTVATGLNLPTADRGSFQVFHTSGSLGSYTNALQMWLPSGEPALWLRTIQTNGSWTAWKEIGALVDQVGATTKFIGHPTYANQIVRTDENGKLVVSTGAITSDYDVANKSYVDSASFVRGTLSASDNPDNMAAKQFAGAWQVTSTPVAEALNLPEPGYGTLIVLWAAGNSDPYYTATQWWVPAGSGNLHKRSIVSRGSWTAWGQLGGGSGGGSIAPAGASESRADLLAASRGGRIGTGGKAVVSLRFDHNMGAFDENILSLLRERQLPATMACYYDMISPVPGYSNDDSAAANKTWGDIQQNFYRGVEVFSHSYSHQDAATTTAIQREIVESRTSLETAMPDVRVHGWAAPGVTGTQYMGWWDVWGDPDARVKHPAGQMLASTYGTYNVSGYGLNELGKKETRYFGIESHTSASTSKAHIDRAIATGTGVTLMVHPKQIGASGKMSLAVFTEVLDYIVAKRDAGEIMVLTMGGQAVADPSTGWRHSLVPNVSGWSGSASGTLTYNLGLGYLHDATGGMRELEATVTGSGSVKLTVTDTGSTVPMNVSRTFYIRDGVETIRLPIGIPRRSSNLQLTAECTNATVADIGLYGI